MHRHFTTCLLIMSIVCTQQVRAQWHSSSVDSLIKQLPRYREDSAKANLYYTISTSCFGYNNDKGLKYGNMGVELATRVGWKPGLVRLHITLGNLESVKQNYQSAVDNYLKSLRYAEEIRDMRGQAVALRSVGNVYSYKIKDYQKAIDYYLRCAALDEKMGDKREAAEMLSEVGSVYLVKKDYTNAIEYYEQAQGKGESAADYSLVGEQLVNIASVFQSQAKYQPALEHIQRAQKFYEAAGDKRGIALSLYKMGNLYYAQKDHAHALDAYQRSLKLSEAAGKKNVTLDNLLGIADVYAVTKDFAHALQYAIRAAAMADGAGNKEAAGKALGIAGLAYYELADGKSHGALPDTLQAVPSATRLQRAHYYLDKAIDLQKETGDYEELAEAYEVLSKVQYAEGDKDGSRESYKQHTTYLEGMYNQDKGTEVARKDMQYVFNKKQETLRQENEAREMAMQKEMQLSALQHEYEMKRAAATSEQERQRLQYEQELKQRQIAYDYEKKQARLEARAALEKASLEKDNALSMSKLREARRERLLYIAGIVLLGVLTAGAYNRNSILKRNKKLLEDKNRQIAAEKENAERMRARAEESEKFKQMFLANMSHEIRTPMNAVSGMTEILLEKQPRTDQVSYLQAISKSSDVLLHIINDILDLSKIEAGKMELEKIDFSLADTIQQVKDTLSHKADEKGLQISIDIAGDVPPVLIGDPFRLNQVLMNLGGNAIKFTERGSLQFKVTNAGDTNDHADLRFEVIDTGIGIPADKIQNLFGNFAQVNNSDTRKYGGTGLGLSISKQLVEMHGGSIAVESVLNSGSTFFFTIRYPKGSAERLTARMQQEQKADGSALNGLRILLVDDNEYNRMVVQETLALKADVMIDMAVNGQEAVDAVSNNTYDVVLMDVQMPVMSGIDATRAIRTQLPSPKKDVPIIALTASTMREDIDKCLNAGMNSYVPKPFKAWQLISTLADVTGRKLVPQQDLPAATQKNAKKATLTQPGMVTDPDYLSNFCEGDPLRIKKYIAMYLKGVPVFLEKLTTARDMRDKKEMALRIHAFKPNWLIMGMKSTSELGSKIERMCHEDGDEVFLRVNELLEHTERSVSELENIT